MITSSELKLNMAAYEAFRRVLETYEKMRDISSVCLYYAGHQATTHRSVALGDEVSVVAKRALVEHWRRKLDLELANLITFGVDASAEMPDAD